MDLVHKDERNELEVLSDTLQMATDVVAQLRNPIYEDWFIVGDNVTFEDFTERFNDEVSGYKIDISLILSEQFNLCALPIVGARSSGGTKHRFIIFNKCSFGWYFDNSRHNNKL